MPKYGAAEPLNSASHTQVSGHYFLRRRLGFALLRRSVQVDPVRWQRVMLMLSGQVGAVFLILAFVAGGNPGGVGAGHVAVGGVRHGG